MHSGRWVYIGNDEIMLEAINLHSQNQILHPLAKNIEVVHIDYDNEKWTDQFLEDTNLKTPDIVFFDFQPISNDDIRIKKFLMLVNIFRRNSMLKHSAFFTIFKDKDQAVFFNYIFTEGVNYGFIKKVEQEQALIDAMYIYYQDIKLRYPIYALAHKMSVPHTIYELGKIMYFKDGIIALDCDREYTIGTIEQFNFNLFEDFKCKEFEIIDTKEIGNYQLYTNSVDLQIKYPSPWEDVPEDSIDERTFLTWLEHNHEDKQLLCSSMSAIIISEGTDLVNEFFKTSQVLPCMHYYTSSFVDASSLIVQHRPDLITFSSPSTPVYIKQDGSPGIDDNENLEQNEVSLEHSEFRTQIHHLINEIRRIEDYSPYIIYFSPEKEVQLLKDYFGYSNFLPVQHQYETKFYVQLIEKITEKLKSKRNQTIYHPYPHDHRKMVELPREVIITGLTEHEITFLCEEELPLFTQLKMYFPFPTQMITIAPTRELNYVPKYRHQMALFHSMSEEDLSLMRRFVNYIIYQPIDKFYFDPNKMVVPEDEGIEVASKGGLEVAGVTAKNRHTIKYHTVDRQRNKGKCKL